MAQWKEVKVYALLWGFKDKKGKIRLYFSNEDYEDLSVDSGGEFCAGAAILGDSGKAYFETERKMLRTGLELTGPDV